jgi:hypothetical protein
VGRKGCFCSDSGLVKCAATNWIKTVLNLPGTEGRSGGEGRGGGGQGEK